MAIDYANIFADVGILVKNYNLFYSDSTSLSGRIDAIQVQLADAHQEAAIEGLRATQEDAWLAEFTSRRSVIAGYVAARLADQETVLEFISATSKSDVMPKLIEAMTAASQSVNASSTSLGSVTANGSNHGDGTVLVTQLLDRVTSPGSRAGVNFPAHHLYGDLTSELTITETMAIRCIGDSFFSGQTEGSETFSWYGGLADSTHGVQATEGSGSVASLVGLHSQTSKYFQNADFETFSVTNTPDNWTIDAGAVTTNILSATGTEKYHGTTGLRFLGDGATASIQISQAIAPSSVIAGKRYAFTCRVKASATIAAGALTISLTGTGYTAGASEKISIAAGSLPTSWTLKNFFVMLPLELPSDLAITIKWNGTPTNAKNLYIDDLAFGEVTYGAGLGLVVVRGATPFVLDDRFTFTVTATEGVIQKFFRRAIGYQLPSNAAAGETINDSLAT